MKSSADSRLGLKHLLLAGLFLLCLAFASYRLFADPLYRFYDFCPHWTSARAFIHGSDPYESENLARIWASSNLSHRPTADVAIAGPSTLVVLAPLIGWLDARAALAVWIVAILILYGIAVWSAAGAVGLRFNEARTWIFFS
ncbi:MAG TPA: hypothetical protein VGI75_05785, partial [Pirellulales bacterium]